MDLGRQRPAHLALARAHEDRAVALERLDVGEALRDALLELLDGDVLAEADEPLASLRVRRAARSARDAERGPRRR